MALLYLAAGFFLGGVLALIVMAMFFIANMAGNKEEQMSSVASRQKIT